MYLGLVIVIVLAGLYAGFGPRLAPFRSRHVFGLTFAGTVAATFAGVLLALQLSDASRRMVEQEDARRLLEAGLQDVRHAEAHAEEFYTLLPVDKYFWVLIRSHKQPYPSVLDLALATDLVVKQLDPEVYPLLRASQWNLRKTHDHVFSGPGGTFEDSHAAMQTYVDELPRAAAILELQLDCLRGLSNDEFRARLDLIAAERESVGIWAPDWVEDSSITSGRPN